MKTKRVALLAAVLLASLMVIVPLAGCGKTTAEKPKILIRSGVSKKNKLKEYNGVKYNVKAKVTLPTEAKYLTVSYDGVVVESIKANKKHQVTWTDNNYGLKVTFYATNKNYKYPAKPKKVKFVDRLTVKGTDAVQKHNSDDDNSEGDYDDTFVNDTSTDESSDNNSSADQKFDSVNYPVVSFDSLARTPDQYESKNIQLTGKVLQVIEGDDENNLRVAVNGDYNDVVLVEYFRGIMLGTRVLEDDKVTLYGISMGTTTYESTMGADITIPDMNALNIVDSGQAPDDYGL